jgi:hypothetical protein
MSFRAAKALIAYTHGPVPGYDPERRIGQKGLEPPQRDGVVNRCVDASDVRELLWGLWGLWGTPSATTRPCSCTRRRLEVARARTVIPFRRPLSRSSLDHAPVLSSFIYFRKS